jgi:transposase InsO family protein
MVPYTWQNAKVERFHLSLKDEVLYRLPIPDVLRVGDLCVAYQQFHNNDRTHQSIEGHFPSRTNVQKLPIPLASIEKFDRLDGSVTISTEAA